MVSTFFYRLKSLSYRLKKCKSSNQKNVSHQPDNASYRPKKCKSLNQKMIFNHKTIEVTDPRNFNRQPKNVIH